MDFAPHIAQKTRVRRPTSVHRTGVETSVVSRLKEHCFASGRLKPRAAGHWIGAWKGKIGQVVDLP